MSALFRSIIVPVEMSLTQFTQLVADLFEVTVITDLILCEVMSDEEIERRLQAITDGASPSDCHISIKE